MFHVGGAVILNSRWLISTAHHIWDTAPDCGREGDGCMWVGVGSIYRSNATYYKLENWTLHDYFDCCDPETEYDIALLRTEKPIEFNEFVQPANLPENESDEPGNGDLTLAGWGLWGNESNNVLQKATLRQMDKNECQRLWDEYWGDSWKIPSTSFCARAWRVCKTGGDDGGPLYEMVNGEQRLVGIASSLDSENCATPTIGTVPSIFNSVAKFLPWIRSNMSI